ncbi:hypothetical protein T4B_3072 [Trichinella pseudospiralis]|nr:hypothetical protein T4E_3494 [Trichinella pseudospiralis]KRZ19711.1 hypothetical protein T4B_3072 [Trichinella pseudospiralis]
MWKCKSPTWPAALDRTAQMNNNRSSSVTKLFKTDRDDQVFLKLRPSTSP